MTDQNRQILIGGIVNGHVAAKYVYVRLFRNNSDRMHKRDWVSFGYWAGIGTALWIIAWIIAEAIPVFQNLLSLVVCCRHLIPMCPNPADCLAPGFPLRQLVYMYASLVPGDDATR